MKKRQNDEKISAPALAAAIKTQRHKVGLSQQELADLSGTSVNLIRQIEGGKESAHLSKVLDILTALGLEFHLRTGNNRISTK